MKSTVWYTYTPNVFESFLSLWTCCNPAWRASIMYMLPSSSSSNTTSTQTCLMCPLNATPRCRNCDRATAGLQWPLSIAPLFVLFPASLPSESPTAQYTILCCTILAADCCRILHSPLAHLLVCKPRLCITSLVFCDQAYLLLIFIMRESKCMEVYELNLDTWQWHKLAYTG